MKNKNITTLAVSISIATVIAFSNFQNAESFNSETIENNCSASPTTPEQETLKIFSADVKIIGPNGSEYNFGNHRVLGQPPLSNTFGNPDKITDFFYEMDEMWVKKWEYPGVIFYILPDGQLDAFHFNGPGFKLSVKGVIIEVGKPVDALAGAFPNFNNYIINGRTVSFTFKTPDGELSDEFMGIRFDPKTRLVVEMYNGMP